VTSRKDRGTISGKIGTGGHMPTIELHYRGDLGPSWQPRSTGLPRRGRLVRHRSPRRPSAIESDRWSAKEVSASSGGDKTCDPKGDNSAHDGPADERPTASSPTSLGEEELHIGPQGLRL
jgi:hypothetical protein